MFPRLPSNGPNAKISLSSGHRWGYLTPNSPLPTLGIAVKVLDVLLLLNLKGFGLNGIGIVISAQHKDGHAQDGHRLDQERWAWVLG